MISIHWVATSIHLSDEEKYLKQDSQDRKYIGDPKQRDLNDFIHLISYYPYEKHTRDLMLI